MAQLIIEDYPNRYAMANELHARPFPELKAPCRAVYLALKTPEGAADRDDGGHTATLIALLDTHGVPHPPPGASHYSGPLGRALLKWEVHTEFVTYTLFADQVSETPFSGDLFRLFPEAWLSGMPGKVVTSCIVRVESVEPGALDRSIGTDFSNWFVRESLVVSQVVDASAVVAADFRIDENGHSRLAVLALPGIGERRLGRVVQRLLEIETYKNMAMLTLPLARQVARNVARLDGELSKIVSRMAAEGGHEVETLDELLRISAEVEHLSAASAFRFGAAGAYEAIVNQRIEVMREERIGGRQLLREFMMRRFDPAMRTCRSARDRLGELSDQAERAANLLRTRVDVANQQQNNEIMRQMDERAALQLRLQETVEGLSIVAISYYAVNLAAYLFAPLAGPLGLAKSHLQALLIIPVVLAVWMMVRRIRSRIAHK